MCRWHALVLVLVSFGLLGAADDTDPRYWKDRLEQALLPRTSLRADFVVESRDRSGPLRELRARLTRIQGPSKTRSIVEVSHPARERRVLKVSSTPDGDAEKVVYLGYGDPLPGQVSRHDRVLGSSLSLEDLGFVAPDHLIDATVDFADLPSGRVVRLTKRDHGPHGRVVVSLDPETAIPSRVEYFGRDGNLARSVTYTDIDEEGPYRFPLRIESFDVRSGQRSVLRFERVELGPEVYEYEFGDRHLRRLLRELGGGSSGRLGLP